MAVKFLSQEWAEEVTKALNSSDEFKSAAGRQSVKLQQVIANAPGGESKYYFDLRDGTVEVSLGEITNAEATLSQSYDTAVAIAKTELNPQQAFMQGKVKISGNMMKLLQLQGVFSALPKAVSGLEVEY